ncbi:nucleotide sugar dehydrogenase [Corynebacterium poyangense]|uniref:UDP-glucose 6-dehydrogenase n=1 Tax=Corynebacterium poyangense TaxID=2684405 RepID=A0A7H0SRH4_9CORY|nr:UDP-glucose/GDP-mannose dehydrogenase family protein [Corynebacterium poyangense]QNQ91149.1 nucleotide sugar dehydrogenase [Corynebacterium poyangense]
MKLTVLGLGYLGTTHAVCMAALGHEVVGIDIDSARVAALSQGQLPFHEPGLPELLKRTLDAHSISFSTDFSQAAEFSHLHFLTVGTPQLPGSEAADLSQVWSAVDHLVPRLASGNHLLVGKSTVPVGTAEQLQQRVNSVRPPGVTVEVAWNPEFLREGHGVEDTLHPDRIVVGTQSGWAEQILRQVYAQPCADGAPVLGMDLATAELVKTAANSFLATKISFINAMAEICEATGADVQALAQALGSDPRIGPRYLHAGLGFGGGCLPKDIRAFMARAGELGTGKSLAFLREVDEINLRRRKRVIHLAEELLGNDLRGSTITVLGAAFKPDSDDVRDSPALAVAGELSLAGAQVKVYDPQANDTARRVSPTLSYAPDISSALAGADLVILATEWECFTQLDPVHAAAIVATPRMIDARNVLDARQWTAAGWQIRALGRSPQQSG